MNNVFGILLFAFISVYSQVNYNYDDYLKEKRMMIESINKNKLSKSSANLQTTYSSANYNISVVCPDGWYIDRIDSTSVSALMLESNYVNITTKSEYGFCKIRSQRLDSGYTYNAWTSYLFFSNVYLKFCKTINDTSSNPELIYHDDSTYTGSNINNFTRTCMTGIQNGTYWSNMFYTRATVNFNQQIDCSITPASDSQITCTYSMLNGINLYSPPTLAKQVSINKQQDKKYIDIMCNMLGRSINTKITKPANQIILERNTVNQSRSLLLKDK